MSHYHNNCGYPSEPCSCPEGKRTGKAHPLPHKRWCDYPSGPCDCGAEKHNQKEGKR